MQIKQLILPFLALVLYCPSYAQTNLVPNGSFEQYSTCPSTSGQSDNAIGWAILKNSPDYFHSCATSTDIGIPINLLGQQYPASGNAFQGFFTYSIAGSNYREILGAQLTTSLSIGQKYYIKFKLNLTLDYVSNTATDKTGIRFSTVQHNSLTALPPINNFAHVFVTSPVTDTINWTTVFKSFIADSSYKFIEIGNFFDDASTIAFVQWPQANNASYYYFDELCVSTDSLFTLNFTTDIIQLEQKSIFKTFPNPNNNGILFFSKFLDNAEVTLFDQFGKQVDLISVRYSDQIKFSLSEGFYYIKISSSKINVTEKLIIKN